MIAAIASTRIFFSNSFPVDLDDDLTLLLTVWKSGLQRHPFKSDSRADLLLIFYSMILIHFFFPFFYSMIPIRRRLHRHHHRHPLLFITSSSPTSWLLSSCDLFWMDGIQNESPRTTCKKYFTSSWGSHHDRISWNHRIKWKTSSSSSRNILFSLTEPPMFTIKPREVYQKSLNEEVRMSCAGEGQPKPVISWRRAGGAKMPKDRVIIDQGNLTIKSLKKEDHGKYECILENEVATLVASTVLRLGSTTPHAPTNVTVNSSAFSATISWLPSHDGGYEQTYIIWYRQSDGQTAADADWKTIKVYPEGSTTFTLYNLQQDTEYEFQVYSRNILGDGLPSPIIRARTKAWTYTENGPILPTDGYGSTYIPPIIQKSKQKRPGAPRNVTVERVAQGHVIAWLPPTQSSDSVPVAYYYVEYTIPPSTDPSQWLQFGPITKENSFLIKNLKPGKYLLRVIAYSLLGAGHHSHPYEFEVAAPGTKNTRDKAIAAGVVGGILFFVAAIVLSVCAVKICNKRKRRKAEKGNFADLERALIEFILLFILSYFHWRRWDDTSWSAPATDHHLPATVFSLLFRLANFSLCFHFSANTAPPFPLPPPVHQATSSGSPFVVR